MADTVDASDGPLLRLRRQVLKVALNLVAVATTLISLLLIVQAVREGRLDTRLVLLSSYTLLFPLLRWLLRWLGFRAAAGIFLGLLALTAFIVEVNGGVTVASTMVSIIAVLLAGIFFGGRGAVFVLLASLLAFVLAGVLVVEGAAVVTLSMWNPLRASMWLRQGVAYVLFGSAITAAVVYVVQRLESEAIQLRRSLVDAQAEREARERAEAEREAERGQREEAQHALAQAQRSEALGRMAAGIAHDFNNSLTVIMNAAGLALLEAGISENARSNLSEIEFAAQRAAMLTKELLVFAKHDVAQPRRLQVDQSLARLTGSLRRLLPANTQLSVESHSRAVVCLDETQFERVMMNLTVNARDAVAANGGNIAITARSEVAPANDGPTPRHRVVVSVSDTGAGMDEATRSRIFEPFFTTKDRGKGTGLGLALVESIVREAGGFVEVRSAPGAGSTFELHLPSSEEGPDPLELPLPVDASEPPGRSPAPRGSPGSPGLRAKGAPGCVLVVDDRHDVRLSMSRALAYAGFEVDTAADGDQALLALDRLGGRVNLLCIDAVMPGTGTAAVIERAVRRYPQIRVLLCSGHVEAELLRRGIAAGKYAFLQKPFTSAELIERVQRALGHPA
jgi:signal transduction histidine kinase/CheY-like chemotaxis protein